MASIETTNYTENVRPAFIGDYRNREHVLPGGIKLDASAFSANSDGKKFVQAGTVLGATYAENEAGDAWGPAADSDDIVRVLAYDVADAAKDSDADVLRQGTLIKIDVLPGWSDLSSTVKGKVRAAYETTASVGIIEDYEFNPSGSGSGSGEDSGDGSGSGSGS